VKYLNAKGSFPYFILKKPIRAHQLAWKISGGTSIEDSDY